MTLTSRALSRLTGSAGSSSEGKTFTGADLQTARTLPASAGRILLFGDASATYQRLYESQPWVYTVITKISRALARLPFKPYAANPADEHDRTRLRRDHPLGALLEQPVARRGGFWWREQIFAGKAMYGNYLLVKLRTARGAPTSSLFPVPWPYVRAVPSRKVGELFDYYIVRTPAGEEFPFLASEVVHGQWFGASGAGFGVSPLEPLRSTLALEDAALRLQSSSYENGGRVSGAFTTDQKLSQEQADDLRERLQDLYGGVDLAFRVALLHSGLDWANVAQNFQESEVIATRKLTREEVAAVYDVPPPMIQILDRATFSNISEQHRIWYMDTLGPWITSFEEELLVQLLLEEPAFADTFAEFDMNEVLRGDPATAAIVKQREFQSGAATPNELRKLDNRPRIDDPRADAVYVPLNMVPIGAGLEEPAAGGDAPGRASIDDAVDARVLELLESSRATALTLTGTDGKSFEWSRFTADLDAIVPGKSAGLPVPPPDVWDDRDEIRRLFTELEEVLTQ